MMLRNLLWSVLIILLLISAAIFAALNTGRIQLDLAFVSVEAQKSIVLIITFTIGWIFGLLCAGLFILRLLTERRRLRRVARLAEEELRALRSLPIKDAD